MERNESRRASLVTRKTDSPRIEASVTSQNARIPMRQFRQSNT